MDFNPRTPVGCDTRIRQSVAELPNFNPRTPVGCDAELHPESAIAVISIHAPQWGATAPFERWCDDRIFQSTHPSGVRLPALQPLMSALQFQSTHPSGVRPDDTQAGTKHPMISIHAPQWGATQIYRHSCFVLKISIHAPQWGATSPSSKRLSHPLYFNPRTPVGCDPSNSANMSGLSNFNPRTPVGCDPISL